MFRAGVGVAAPAGEVPSPPPAHVDQVHAVSWGELVCIRLLILACHCAFLSTLKLGEVAFKQNSPSVNICQGIR